MHLDECKQARLASRANSFLGFMRHMPGCSYKCSFEDRSATLKIDNSASPRDTLVIDQKRPVDSDGDSENDGFEYQWIKYDLLVNYYTQCIFLNSIS